MKKVLLFSLVLFFSFTQFPFGDKGILDSNPNPNLPKANQIQPLKRLDNSSVESSIGSSPILPIGSHKRARRMQDRNNQSIETLQYKYLSRKEMKLYAEDGNIERLIKYFDIAIGDQVVSCDNKILYLQQYLRVVKIILDKKKFNRQQILTMVQTSKREIKRLTDEIQRLHRQRKKLNIQSYRNKLQDVVSRLRKIQDGFERAKNQVIEEEAKLVQLNQQIKNLISETKEVQKIKQLKDEEKRIKGMIQFQLSSQNLLKKLENLLPESLIEENQKKIKGIQSSIQSGKSKVNETKDQIYFFRKDYGMLGVEKKRTEDEIKNYEESDENMAEQIKENENRRSSQFLKIASLQANKGIKMFQKLEYTFPLILPKMNKAFYECYSEDKVEKFWVDQVSFYRFKVDEFTKYVQNVYGDKIKPKIQATTKLQFTILNSFSPFIHERINSIQKSKNSDASCLIYGRNVLTGQGQIELIESNQIRVANKFLGSSISLKLNECSRIESSTSVPTVGQNIIWKISFTPRDSGIYQLSQEESLRSAIEYNLLLATCY